MKAILWKEYGSADLLQVGEVAKPIPKDNELLVKVKAASVTPGDCELRRFDMHVLFWLPVRIYMGFFKPRKKILGMELSGVVERIGKDITGYNVGDDVICGTGLGLSAYAEYKCVKESSFTIKKPTNVSYNEAATLPTGGSNALHYVRKGNIQPEQKVLIIGAAGCFGTYAVQLVKILRAEITAIDSGDKLELLRTIGADHVIDYTKQDFVNDTIKYDVIIDIAGKNSVTHNMKALTNNGRYILATPWVKQVIQGTLVSLSSSKKFIFQLASENIKDLEYLAQLLQSGELKSIIDRTYALEEMSEAHKYVEGGEKIGHVSININQQ
jgi:NADPH:quinone reductase-like Zn-dependent oxidoreductase